MDSIAIKQLERIRYIAGEQILGAISLIDAVTALTNAIVITEEGNLWTLDRLGDWEKVDLLSLALSGRTSELEAAKSLLEMKL